MAKTWAERKAERMRVPWDEETPDARGFWEYVRQHYSECLTLASEIVRRKQYPDETHWRTLGLVFNKLASPLVYLWEAWSVLAPEKKAKYNPELAKIHEKSKELAEKAFTK